MNIVTSFLFTSLRKADLLSPNIGFEFNGTSHFQSYQGGIYSMIVITITIYIAATFSKETIFRENPIVISNQEVIPNSIVDLKRYPIVISISDDGDLNDDYLNYFAVESFTFSIGDGPQPKMNQTYIDNPITKCNMTAYNVSDPSVLDLLNFATGPGFFCLRVPDNVIYQFQNAYTELNSTFVQVSFSKCTLKSNKNCRTEISSRIRYTRIGVNFIDSYISSNNFTNPIQYKVTTHNVLLNKDLNKIVFYQFKNDLFVSDNGWILSDNMELEYISFQMGNVDYQLTSGSNDAFRIILESPRLRRVTLRSFLKIQDLLSNVGGFVNIIFTLLYFAVHSHLRFTYLFFLKDLVLNENSIHPTAVFNKDVVQNFMPKLDSKNKNEAVVPCQQTRNEDISKNMMIEKESKLEIDRKVNNYTEQIKKEEGQLPKVSRNPKLYSSFAVDNVSDSYLSYLLNKVSCRKDYYRRYEKQMANIEKIINISVFANIMANHLAN